MLAAGLAAYPVIDPVDQRRVAVVAGALGVVGIVLAIFDGWATMIGWALAAFVAEYGIAQVGAATIDPAAVIYAAGLVLLAEVSLAVIGPVGGRLSAFEAGRMLAVTALAAGAAAAVMGALWLPVGGGDAVLAVGVAAAAALGSGVVLILRQAVAGQAPTGRNRAWKNRSSGGS